MNTPVSFELAKLLKEKGFDIPTKKYYEYALKSKKDKENGYSGSFGWKKGELNLQSDYFQNNSKSDFTSEMWYMCSSPTITEVVMWLYEKHGIWIVASYELNIENHKKEWFWIAIKDGEEIAYQYKDFSSPAEAYEAGIKHALKNLL